MKDISLAAGSMLQALSETPVQKNGAPNEQDSERTPFTLPDMALDAIGQRVHGAKSGAHKSTKAGDSEQNAQMQMLLSLFLAQGAQPDLTQRVQLIAPYQTGKLLGAGIIAGASNGSAAPLSPKLQAVLSTLMSSMPQQDTGTPAQQAQLVQNAAQNLRAIATQNAPQEIKTEAAPRLKDNRVAPRITAADKPDAQKTNQTAMLLNTTFVKNAAMTDSATATPVTTLKLDTQTADWGEQLSSVLKDRIQFQLNEQQQTSTIRLDPPSLGKMSISIQLDAGKLVVHIDASQADVSRALTQLSDNLRQHLTQQNFMQVDVQVSSDGRSQQDPRQGNQERSQQQIVSAAELESEDNNGKQNESVLIKV